MKKEVVLQRMKEDCLIAVIRAKNKEQGEKLVDSIIKGGINFIEITMTMDEGNPVEFIAFLAQKYKDNPKIVIGAGTVMALEAGCDVIKLFPGNILGPAAISTYKGPLPQGEFMPSGGVDVDNVDKWLKAGAYAVGTGSSLTKGAKTGDFDAVEAKAKEFVEAVKKARS